MMIHFQRINSPFNIIEAIRLSIDEETEEKSYDKIQKAVKKHMDEKQNDIDKEDSSDESDNQCGITEEVTKRNFANVLVVLNVKDVNTLNVVLLK